MSQIADKKHYDLLDGLRGIAAVLVVVSHLFESYSFGPPQAFQPVGHSHLAVVFFFALSGFVLAYAYDDRWARGLGYLDFFKRRLIRLYPLVFLGTLLGLAIYLFGGTWAYPQFAGVGPWSMVLLVGFALLLIPCPQITRLIGINPFNGPNWSLAYEYLANILYAFFFRRLGRKALVAAVVVSAFLGVAVVCKIDLFGLIGGRRTCTLLGGHSANLPSLYVGVTQLLFPFFLGMMICRFKLEIRSSHGFLWSALLLVIAVCCPHDGNGLPFSKQYVSAWNGAFELLSLFVLMPLVMAIGAGSSIGGPGMTKFFVWLGNISYPLYMTHYPFVQLHHAWVRDHYAQVPVWGHWAIGVVLLLLFIGFAAIVDRAYDVPVRRILSGRWKQASRKTISVK